MMEKKNQEQKTNKLSTTTREQPISQTPDCILTMSNGDLQFPYTKL